MPVINIVLIRVYRRKAKRKVSLMETGSRRFVVVVVVVFISTNLHETRERISISLHVLTELSLADVHIVSRFHETVLGIATRRWIGKKREREKRKHSEANEIVSKLK